MPPRSKALAVTQIRASRRKDGKTRANGPQDPFLGPVSLSVRGDPFPLRFRSTLRYCQAVTLTAGAAGVFGTEQVFRLNSLYDPDLTGTGHQPYGFDTLATLYYKYKVLAVRVSLKVSDPSADGIQFAAHFQAPDVTYTVTGTLPDVNMEKPGMLIRDINNTGSQVVNFTQRWLMHTLCGITPLEFAGNTDEYAAATSASPVKTPFVRCAIAALDGSSTPTVRLQCCLEFETEFFERIILGQS